MLSTKSTYRLGCAQKAEHGFVVLLVEAEVEVDQMVEVLVAADAEELVAVAPTPADELAEVVVVAADKMVLGSD
jgi:hypothetical protein